jgi:hypothetical protein
MGPSRAPRGMSGPVSSLSLSGILSRPVSCLGRVASPMSHVACFEAPRIHTVLNLTGQIVPFFTNTSTEKVFSQFKPGGRDLDIQRIGRLSRQFLSLFTLSNQMFGSTADFPVMILYSERPLHMRLLVPNNSKSFTLWTSVVDADPDSNYHPDADPDPDFYLLRIRIRI